MRQRENNIKIKVCCVYVRLEKHKLNAGQAMKLKLRWVTWFQKRFDRVQKQKFHIFLLKN